MISIWWARPRAHYLQMPSNQIGKTVARASPSNFIRFGNYYKKICYVARSNTGTNKNLNAKLQFPLLIELLHREICREKPTLSTRQSNRVHSLFEPSLHDPFDLSLLNKPLNLGPVDLGPLDLSP